MPGSESSTTVATASCNSKHSQHIAWSIGREFHSMDAEDDQNADVEASQRLDGGETRRWIRWGCEGWIETTSWHRIEKTWERVYLIISDIVDCIDDEISLIGRFRLRLTAWRPQEAPNQNPTFAKSSWQQLGYSSPMNRPSRRQVVTSRYCIIASTVSFAQAPKFRNLIRSRV